MRGRGGGSPFAVAIAATTGRRTSDAIKKGEYRMFNRLQMFLGRVYASELSDIKREEGQTVTEYAVVLGVLIVALAGIVITLRTGINTFLGKVSTALSNLIP